MRRILAIILLVVGLGFIGYSGWELIDANKQQAHSMAQATETIQKAKENNETREQFKPGQNETIGVLRIPKINAELPIVEGTDPDDLKKGVGHYSGTAFPSDHDQILLSGHRDTVFRRFGELQKGDEFIVELPYGTFHYKMDHSRIVKADDTTVIAPTKPNEVLNLSTCYPFRYIGSAPDRYIIYAYPVEKQS